jgi:putative sterol carrier protein
MATAEEITQSLESFAQSCRENVRLSSMIKDWNRTMHIEAADLGSDNTLVTAHGVVSTSSGAPDSPDMTIVADSEILTQIFYGELSPNEPYNDGTLRIKGAEEDIVRLDFLIAMIWE